MSIVKMLFDYSKKSVTVSPVKVAPGDEEEYDQFRKYLKKEVGALADKEDDVISYNTVPDEITSVVTDYLLKDGYDIDGQIQSTVWFIKAEEDSSSNEDIPALSPASGKTSESAFPPSLPPPPPPQVWNQ